VKTWESSESAEGEEARDAGLDVKTELKCLLYQANDRLSQEIDSRYKQIKILKFFSLLKILTTHYRITSMVWITNMQTISMAMNFFRILE